jgi:hypothetical protein
MTRKGKRETTQEQEIEPISDPIFDDFKLMIEDTTEGIPCIIERATEFVMENEEGMKDLLRRRYDDFVELLNTHLKGDRYDEDRLRTYISCLRSDEICTCIDVDDLLYHESSSNDGEECVEERSDIKWVYFVIALFPLYSMALHSVVNRLF